MNTDSFLGNDIIVIEVCEQDLDYLKKISEYEKISSKSTKRKLLLFCSQFKQILPFLSPNLFVEQEIFQGLLSIPVNDSYPFLLFESKKC